jgi:hypothetical protein
MFSGGDVQQPEILRCAQNDNKNVILRSVATKNLLVERSIAGNSRSFAALRAWPEPAEGMTARFA